MNDERIIELYWQRSEQAIQLSGEHYGDYCFTIAHNILKNRLDSEECVNVTWVRTWNSIPPQRPRLLKAFFAKITRNLSFDRYKALTAEKRGGGEIELALEELGDCLSYESDVESHVTSSELADVINRFLRDLPERDCNIFLRRYFFVESVKDISHRFEISENNVHLILSRTRKKLKSYLIKEGYDI